MKKLQTVALCTASAILALSLAGCSGGSQQPSDENNAISGEVSDSTAPEEKGVEPQQVSVGETFTIPDLFEVTLESAEWLDEIYVGDSYFGWSVAQAEDDSSYFVVHATIKNIGTTKESLGSGLNSSTNLGGQFLINGKYEIDAEARVIYNDETIGTSSNIEPLKTESVIIYASVSDEIRNMFDGCELTLSARQIGEDNVWHMDEEPLGQYVANFR